MNGADINQTDVRELMKRAQAGDASAFSEIYGRYLTPVFRYVYFRVKQREEAEDLTQTIFMKVFNGLDDIVVGTTDPLAYFYTVARNTVIDYWRKKKDVSFADNEDTISQIPDTKDSPLSSVIQGDQANTIKAALVHLSDDQRQVIELKFFFDLSADEIAKRIGKSVDAVRQLQCRGLKVLRTHIHEGD